MSEFLVFSFHLQQCNIVRSRFHCNLGSRARPCLAVDIFWSIRLSSCLRSVSLVGLGPGRVMCFFPKKKICIFFPNNLGFMGLPEEWTPGWCGGRQAPAVGSLHSTFDYWFKKKKKTESSFRVIDGGNFSKRKKKKKNLHECWKKKKKSLFWELSIRF